MPILSNFLYISNGIALLDTFFFCNESRNILYSILCKDFAKRIKDNIKMTRIIYLFKRQNEINFWDFFGSIALSKYNLSLELF